VAVSFIGVLPVDVAGHCMLHKFEKQQEWHCDPGLADFERTANTVINNTYGVMVMVFNATFKNISVILWRSISF
jgi:hypothetical protein